VKAQLPDSLRGAELTSVTQPAWAGIVRGALQPLGERAQVFEDIGALVAAVSAAAREGDHVLVMSNGGFCGVHGRLLEALASR